MSQPKVNRDDDPHRLLDELASQQRAEPVDSVNELAGALWESDEELDDFLEYVRRERDSDLI